MSKKILLLKTIIVVLCLGTIGIVIYGLNTDCSIKSNIYVTDGENVELTDDALEVMSYYYNEADEKISDM